MPEYAYMHHIIISIHDGCKMIKKLQFRRKPTSVPSYPDDMHNGLICSNGHIIDPSYPHILKSYENMTKCFDHSDPHILGTPARG